MTDLIKNRENLIANIYLLITFLLAIFLHWQIADAIILAVFVWVFIRRIKSLSVMTITLIILFFALVSLLFKNDRLAEQLVYFSGLTFVLATALLIFQKDKE